MNKFSCILFDLDGTLIDTTPLILDSFKHTFLYHFNEEKNDEEILKFLGIPLRESFEYLYPGMQEALSKTYKEFNEFRHDGHIGVFIDIVPVLEKLKQKGVMLGVVTSKRRSLALRGMQLFGIDEFMSVFIGLEDSEKHKPDGEPVLNALKIAGIQDKDSVLYVGDSPHDILCAKNAGVKSAAVAWSYIHRDELLKAEPDIVLESPRDMLEYV